MADLHLNLKGEHFDEIQAGRKTHEYRLASTWLKRLQGKSFDRVLLKRGYPRAGDIERILVRPWRGYEVVTRVVPLYGEAPVEVLAIPVHPPQGEPNGLCAGAESPAASQ